MRRKWASSAGCSSWWVGTGCWSTPQQVLEVINRSFNIKLTLLSIMPRTSQDFLVMLSDRATTDSLLVGSLPLLGPGFSLLFKHWTWLANAMAAIHQITVDLELHDIPAHAWETSTTQALLGGSCLVCTTLPNTVVRHDLSSFYVSVWCMRLDSIPLMVDLFIPNLVRRCHQSSVTSSIQVAYVPSSRRRSYRGVLYPGARQFGQGSRHRCSSSPRPLASRSTSGVVAPSGRAPVHSRLGPEVEHTSSVFHAMDRASKAAATFPR
jgi:hypothetical protein